MTLPAQAGDDIVDRKAQRLIADRFRAHHRERLERVRAGLDAESRVVFDALPLLIHVNHPALPGFVDYDMPAGIDRYTPDRVAIAAARRIALSYAPERLIERTRHVQAVLLEPAATPADTHRLFVCCRESHHEALERKLNAIRTFAGRANLALSTQLADPLAVRSRAMSLGSTPALALDRFYLDALWLAGRYPLWWLIPVGLAPERHAEHATRLTQQRFVAPDETFDFGPVPAVAAEEWYETAIELLERAETNPLGALRELQLIEARTSRWSSAAAGLLAEVYKTAVHRDQKVNSAELDTAALTRLEVLRYLALEDAPVRLEHAKRLHSEGFGIDRSWSLARRIDECKLMRQELDRALRLASAFRARATRAAQSLEQRLQQAHDRLFPARADEDEIPAVFPELIAHAAPTPIAIDRHDDRWRVREGQTTLFSASRLVPIAVWLHFHRVVPERLVLEETATKARLERVLATLRARSVAGTAAELPAHATTLVLVNAEHEPLERQLATEQALVSEWDDPLDYSGYHHNLVASVDLVELERSAIHHGDDGASAIARALDAALARDPDGVALHCVGTVQTRAIETRIRELMAEIRAAFHGDSAAGRFVLPNGAGFTIATRSVAGIEFTSVRDENGLVTALRSPLPSRRPVTLADSRSRALLWLRRLAELVEVGRATLLIVEDEGAEIWKATASPGEMTLYLCDQDGSIHRFSAQGRTTEQLAGDLTAFLGRQRLHAAATPKVYSSSAHGLTELRMSPDASVPRLSVRVRREPGRVDLFHGERRWSNVAINDALLDDVLAGMPRRAPSTLAAVVGHVEFEADTPRLKDLLALKLGFERRLLERTRRR